MVFYQHTIVKFAQTQKIDIFWITQSLVYLEPFLYYQSGNFWRFRGDFGKKNDFKNFFFLQISPNFAQKKRFANFFFSKFCKSLFLSIIWRDLKKKKFLKFLRKIFENLEF